MHHAERTEKGAEAHHMAQAEQKSHDAEIDQRLSQKQGDA